MSVKGAPTRPPSALPVPDGDESEGNSHAVADGDTTAFQMRALLGELTAEQFASVSDQIIALVNNSAGEARAETLYATTQPIFEAAVEDEIRSPLIARLCQTIMRLRRTMMQQISDGVMNESIKNAEGQPIKVGLVFRRYLISRCKQEFERKWSVQAQTAAAAAAKEKAGKDESSGASQGQGSEDPHSHEYYAAQKAKCRGPGLVRFIGELFKLQMLTERIMHEYIMKLLRVSNVDNPGEEEIESICKLLSTVGQALDTSKARSHMDIYFKRMRNLSDSPNIDSRMKVMLQDVIELRERKWIPRNATAAPSDYGSHADADSRSTPASRAPASKAGDLSQFDKISKSASGVVSLGPASVFAGKKRAKRKHTASLSRSSSSNPPAALTRNPGENSADAPSTSRSRKPSVDFSQSGLSEGGGRRKLQLLPRSKPLEEVSATPEKPETPEESEDENAAPTPDEDEPPKKVLSEAQIKKQIEEDTKEFFAVRKLDESEQYFESLPEDQRHRLVDAVFTRALDGKEAEATLVGNLFALVLEKGKVTPDILEQGFSGTMEFLDDMAVDVPAAYALTAKIMHLSKFDEARVRRLAEKIAVDGDPLVAPKDKLLKEFSKLSW